MERQIEGSDGERLRVVFFGAEAPSGSDGGNGRFLHGVRGELIARGHEVRIHASPGQIEPVQTLDGVDVAVVHDATPPELVRRIRLHHARSDGYRLLFYDTHRREATAPPQLRRFNLAGFDGVLAATEAIRESYLQRGWEGRAFTWHEAADTYVFSPHRGAARNADLVWIGDGHDVGACHELAMMLLEPARRLRLSGVIHGEGHTWRARMAMQRSGLRFGGPLSEHLVPAVWARHRFTVALPPARHAPPGTPPARALEALACGIPLISAPWDDVEQLFRPGRDFLRVEGGAQMRAALADLLADPDRAEELARSGRETVLARHTCAHRVDELLRIVHEELALDPPSGARRAAAR